MANYINQTSQGFTQVPNWLLNEPRLSLKAKGLWAYLASKPTGWAFSANRIASQTLDGKESVGSGLRELEEAGLLRREVKSRGFRQFETTYILTAGGKFADVKYGNDLYGDVKPVSISNKEDSNKECSNKEKRNLMSAPSKPAPTREIDATARELAAYLHEKILTNKPDRKIQTGWEERWAQDIEKMHRIDGRAWVAIRDCITWSQQDDFWRQNILSGEKLRKHYDRMSDRARTERRRNLNQDTATAIFGQTDSEAIKNAKKLGVLPL